MEHLRVYPHPSQDSASAENYWFAHRSLYGFPRSSAAVVVMYSLRSCSRKVQGQSLSKRCTCCTGLGIGVEPDIGGIVGTSGNEGAAREN